jgi:hypothetical protein
MDGATQEALHSSPKVRTSDLESYLSLPRKITLHASAHRRPQDAQVVSGESISSFEAMSNLPNPISLQSPQLDSNAAVSSQ